MGRIFHRINMKPAVNICRNISRFPVLLLLLFFVSTTLGYINPTIKKQPVSVATEEEAGDNRIWVPPTQNVEQIRGNIFCIKNPEDLLDFISEDERLCVVKVYANWCRTCKAFDTRYRKLASQLGDKHHDAETSRATHVIRKGKTKFAEMEFAGSNAKLIAALLGTKSISLPYILIYQGSRGLVKSFRCAPKHIKLLVDAIDELADSYVDEDLHEPVNTVLNEYVSSNIQHLSDRKVSRGSELGVTNLYLSNLSRAR